MRSFIYVGRFGCLLPFLIIFNLFFGWIFLRPLVWLGVEAFLILLSVILFYITVRKISRFTPRGKDAIDVEGNIVDKQ